jgi:hypothetical protein
VRPDRRFVVRDHHGVELIGVSGDVGFDQRTLIVLVQRVVHGLDAWIQLLELGGELLDVDHVWVRDDGNPDRLRAAFRRRTGLAR